MHQATPLAVAEAWDEETVGCSLQYGALIRLPGGNSTISLTVHPDEALPWDLGMKLARAEKLRDLIVGKDVDTYLEQHRESFDVVTMRVLETPTKRVANDVAQVVRSGLGTFMDAAQKAFAQDATGRTRLFYRKEPRYRLEPRLAAEEALVIEAAAASENRGVGALIGPIAEGDECILLNIVSIEPAERSANLRSRAVAKLFEEWLREQHQTARIERLWGSAQRTNTMRDATK